MANEVITCAVAAFLILQFISTAVPCDPKCKGVLAGTCLSNGRCLCWWGWTGPNAVYIMSGAGKNRILADYCTNACHYTQVYRNPLCAGIPTPQPQVCSVPAKKTVPAVPCDSLCGTGLYHSAGSCMSNGRCLCWWGWTGPNACYVNGGFHKNRIIADRCVKACHYTHFYKNAKCTASKKPTSLPTTTARPSTTSAKATQSAASVPCDPRCKGGQGTCQSNGRCLCWWGWTGPNAEYIMSGAYKNRIVADYCTTACHYTHDYLNPACASIPTPKVCSVPANKTVPPLPCDPLCGTGIHHSAGQCLSNGRCLCWWGWTGPDACYVDGGIYNNRILADRCDKACHYTHDYRNYNCTSNGTSTAKPSTQPVSTGNPAAASVPCDPRCKGGQGTCRSNGRCLCWWGWTGPHAEYIMSGANKNRILADYCTTACHYTHDYLNPACARIPTPKVCSVPANKTVPPLPCDPLCGTGTYHSAGQCLSNGRCLCWWGWTGPDACYVDGGTYNNRILADRCDKACHYTHDHRNYNCTSNGTSTAKPSTQPVRTGNPGTGSRITGQPTTRMSYQSSTNQQTTQILTTTSPKTSSTTPKQTSTGRPTSVRVPTSNQKSATSGQTTTVAPTTRQKTTTQRVTTMAKRTTTQAAPTTRQRSTTQGTTTTTAKPTTQAATTTSTTTSTVAQTTKQKTTTQGVSSTTTAKATTTQAVTTRAKTTAVSPTTGTMAQTTEQTTTTQAVTTTAKATTTQATTTTEPPEPTEPTEPPEPTEPTEPGVLQVRGMLPNQNQFQDDVDDSEVDDVGDEENQEEEEPNKFSTVALVVVLIVLFVCVTAFVGAVWWTYGNGNQCPSILRGYEPVAGSDVNALTSEFSTSTHLP